MPKTTYKLKDFSGGINNNSDPRDIGDNQCNVLENISVDRGKVVLLGNAQTAHTNDLLGSSAAATVGGNGRGFIAVASDFDGLLDGASASPGQIYYLIQDGATISGKGEDGETGDLAIADMDEVTMVYTDGVLRIWDAVHTGTKGTPKWRGHILGKLYGTDSTAGGSHPSRKGHIYNSGGSKSNQWALATALPQPTSWHGTGAFPLVSLTDEIEKIEDMVGANLICCSKNAEVGLPHDNTSASWAFANERNLLDLTTTSSPADKVGASQPAASGIYWGFALGFEENKSNTGGWMPTTDVSYQFFCSTIYDDNQESNPQLFQMYRSMETYRYGAWTGTPSADSSGGNQGKITFAAPATAGTPQYYAVVGREITGTDIVSGCYIGAVEAASPITWIKVHRDGAVHTLPNTTTQTDYRVGGNYRYGGAARASIKFANGNPSTDSDGNTTGEMVGLNIFPNIKWNGATITHTDDIDTVNYNFGALDTNTATSLAKTSGGNPRITGLRVYWSSSEDGYDQKWIMMEWKFDEGIKSYGTDEGSGYALQDYTNPPGIDGLHYWYHHTHSRTGGSGFHAGTNGIYYENPPRVATYESLNGHPANDVITVESAKCAVFANRRIYLGNISQKKSYNDETATVYPDRMIKSQVNQFDKFPTVNTIDVAINDGDEIIALMEYADRILQFKKNCLYIINVAGASEYLESEHRHKGVSNPGACCRTDYGLAWANTKGAYIYDGGKVHNILESGTKRKIKSDTWSSFIGTNSRERVGFNPFKRQIIIKGDAVAGYVYDMTTQGWTKISNLVNDTDTSTPFINDPANGDLLIVNEDSEAKILKWTDTSVASTIKIVTKDYDMGEPAVRKKIHKIRLSYKGDADQIDVKYSLDGSGTLATFNDTDKPLADVSTAKWHHAELKPTASISNCYSFQMHFEGAAGATFELNDITIIFRVKGVR